MDIDTIRTEADPERTAGARVARRVVDVSDLRTGRIESFVEDGAVHLERRGAKTYLVADD